MEIITLIIGIVLGAVAIWFIAKYKFQKSTITSNEIVRSNSTAIQQPTRIESVEVRAQEPHSPRQEIIVRRDPKNPEYISSAKEVLAEFSRQLTQILPNRIGYCILGKHAELSDWFKKLGENADIDSVYQAITFSGGVEMRSDIEMAVDQVMEFLFELYQDFIDATFAVVPEAVDLKPRFSLSEDQIAQETSKGAMALKRNLSPIFTEFMEMSRLQNQLKSQFPSVKKIVDENQNVDWGSVFKNFGGGALTALNPLIGIPFLLANLFGESKKQKHQEQLLQEYFDNYQTYLEQWDKVRNLYLPIFEKQRKYLEDKISNITETAIPRVLVELDKSGYSLKKVPSQYKKLLKDFKKAIQSN